MCFKKAVAKSSRFSRIFAFGLMIFSGAGLINLCTVCECNVKLSFPRACLKKAFCKMCVTICGIFYPNSVTVAR